MNKSLKALYLYNSIFVFSGQLFGPLYALYVETIISDVTVVSLSWSVFMISSVFFTFLISKFGDRVKEIEYLLIGGYLVRAFVWFMYAFVVRLEFLFFLQIVLGLGEALGTPAYGALIAEHLDSGKHVKDYADWKIISSITGAIATAIGGFIVSIYGYNILFYIMPILAIIPAVGILIKPRDFL